ncbi:MAG: hypothetical protein U1F35_08965 [Steroidobacteraceae bacterium]
MSCNQVPATDARFIVFSFSLLQTGIAAWGWWPAQTTARHIREASKVHQRLTAIDKRNAGKKDECSDAGTATTAMKRKPMIRSAEDLKVSSGHSIGSCPGWIRVAHSRQRSDSCASGRFSQRAQLPPPLLQLAFG